MKIAYVSSEYYPAIGGVGQVVKELAERQAKAGHDVHVFTPAWDKEKRMPTGTEVLNGVTIHRCYNLVHINPFGNLWPSVFKELLKLKPDVIHSHVFGHLHFVLAAFASKVLKVPHVHTTHCPWTDAHRPFLARLGVIVSYGFFSRLALKATDKIIAITPWEYEFIKRYGGKQEQIINIPNGMGELFFKKISPNNFKKRLGIKNKLVLFFGRLNVTKGPEKFVEIAHDILKERKDVTFVIRGPDEGMLEIVKKKIGNEKRIILLDPIRDRKEIIAMYQAADVFVLPSFREGLPLTLFEAMAAGAPIVASPVNGIPYEMKEPENGFLVKYGNNKKFKERIEQFLDDPKLRKKISQNNINKSKKYKWDIIEKQTMDLYKKLLRK